MLELLILAILVTVFLGVFLVPRRGLLVIWLTIAFFLFVGMIVRIFSLCGMM